MQRRPTSVTWGSSPELNNPAWMGGEVLGVRTPPAIDQILSGVGRALATAPERVQGWWNQTDATRPEDQALLGTTLGAAGSGLGDMGLYMVPGAGDAADLGGMAVDMARGELPISPLTAVLAGTAALPFVPGAYRWASSHLPARAPTPPSGSPSAQAGALRIGPDPDELFDPRALMLAGNQNDKSLEKLVYMDPRDFLRLAAPLPGGRPDPIRYGGIDQVLSGGGRLSDVPALWTAPGEGIEAGLRFVRDHEGRHRASWLRDHGYDAMPVRLVDRNIRWGQQLDPNSFDYRADWPEHLVNEARTARHRFPVPRDDALSPPNSRWTQDVPREGPYYSPALARILSGSDEISSAGPIARQRGATLYHGTPHRWRPEPGWPDGRPRYDPSTSGTGEGHSMLGAGLYSAEEPEVGRYYHKMLSDGVLNSSQRFPQDSPERGAQVMLQVFGKDDAIRKLREAAKVPDGHGPLREASARLLEDPYSIFQGGGLYELDMPDEVVAKHLELGAPFVDQPGQAQKALSDLMGGVLYADRRGPGFAVGIDSGPAGRRPLLSVDASDLDDAIRQFSVDDAYKVAKERMGWDADKVSDVLSQHGVPGVWDYDNFTRLRRLRQEPGRETRNFVTFRPQDHVTRARRIE